MHSPGCLSVSFCPRKRSQFSFRHYNYPNRIVKYKMEMVFMRIHKLAGLCSNMPKVLLQRLLQQTPSSGSLQLDSKRNWAVDTKCVPITIAVQSLKVLHTQATKIDLSYIDPHNFKTSIHFYPCLVPDPSAINFPFTGH